MEQQGRLALQLLLLPLMTVLLPSVTHAQQRAVDSVAAAGGGLDGQAPHVAAGGQHARVCGRTRGTRHRRSKCRQPQRACVRDVSRHATHGDAEWEAERSKQITQVTRPLSVTARPVESVRAATL